MSKSTEVEENSEKSISEENNWQHIHFGLLVTGDGEAKFLPEMFRLLTASKICSIEVIRKIEQVRPLGKRSEKILKLAGKTIPNKDMDRIGLPARRYLQDKPQSYGVLIDDLEGSGRTQLVEIYERYRSALTAILNDLTSRASVHFLVNMLEAYYFADTSAVNYALSLQSQLTDYESDVEEIPHPKDQLKTLLQEKYKISFDEIEHGQAIVPRLDLLHILSKSGECRSLRTLFLWCIQKLQSHPGFVYTSLNKQIAMIQGDLFDVTKDQ